MKVAIYLDNVSNAVDNCMQRGIMENIANELEQEHDVMFIDPVQLGMSQAKDKIRLEEYDILLTYNKTGTDLYFEDGVGKKINLLSTLKTPHIAWLTEHPVTFFDQYLASEGNTHYIFPNESHAFFAQMIGLKGSYSCQMFGSNPEKEFPKLSERPFDICVAAQWRGPAENNEIWRNSNSKTKNFFNEVIQLQEIEENRDSFTAYLAAATHYGLDVSDFKKHAIFVRALYWYARKAERIKLVQDLASSGLKILLIGGNEWEKVLSKPYDITFVPPCTHKDLRKWYKMSKMVATVNNFNGANERVFDAKACGSMVLCEASPTLTSIADDQIVFYKPHHLTDNLEAVHDKLNDNSNQSYISYGGLNSWKDRVDLLKLTMDQLIGSIKIKEVNCV